MHRGIKKDNLKAEQKKRKLGTPPPPFEYGPPFALAVHGGVIRGGGVSGIPLNADIPGIGGNCGHGNCALAMHEGVTGNGGNGGGNGNGGSGGGGGNGPAFSTPALADDFPRSPALADDCPRSRHHCWSLAQSMLFLCQLARSRKSFFERCFPLDVRLLPRRPRRESLASWRRAASCNAPFRPKYHS